MQSRFFLVNGRFRIWSQMFPVCWWTWSQFQCLCSCSSDSGQTLPELTDTSCLTAEIQKKVQKRNPYFCQHFPACVCVCECVRLLVHVASQPMGCVCCSTLLKLLRAFLLKISQLEGRRLQTSHHKLSPFCPVRSLSDWVSALSLGLCPPTV